MASKPMANPIIGNAQKVGFQLIHVPRPSQFADRQQPVNCKLVSPNNALVAVGLTLDAVLERVSCYEEEANASRFGFGRTRNDSLGISLHPGH